MDQEDPLDLPGLLTGATTRLSTSTESLEVGFLLYIRIGRFNSACAGNGGLGDMAFRFASMIQNNW
jgi:hypothetical protein